MRVAIIGTGYVGLVSGACLSDFGHTVACIDTDAGKIDALKRSEMPVFEPGLSTIVRRNRQAGRLSFTTSYDAVEGADVVVLAVGTPAGEDGQADLSFLYAAAAEVAPRLTGYTLLVTKSTVPVGTGDEVEALVRRLAPRASFDVASNPEFLREGSAVEDFNRPDRLVLGVETSRAMGYVGELYSRLSMNGTPLVFTDRRTAEITKYAANAFLATKIALTNEISDLCEQVGANVQDVIRGVGLDHRIGTTYLHPGPGYGGSCFPKDTKSLAHSARLAGSPVTIVDAVMAANTRRKRAMADRIVAAVGGSVEGKTVAVLGVTFKPGTDDMRDAASLVIIPALQAAGARVRAFDPEGTAEAKKLLPGVTFTGGVHACVRGADVCVILTEWEEFRALDLARIRRLMRRGILVDLRNLYSPEEMRRAGLVYHSLGRPITMKRGKPVTAGRWWNAGPVASVGGREAPPQTEASRPAADLRNIITFPRVASAASRRSLPKP